MPSRRTTNGYYVNPQLGAFFESAANAMVNDGMNLSKDHAHLANARYHDAQAQKVQREAAQLDEATKARSEIGPAMEQYASRRESMLTGGNIEDPPDTQVQVVDRRRPTTDDEKMALLPGLQALAARAAGLHPDKIGPTMLALTAPYGSPESVQRQFVAAGHPATPQFSATPAEGNRISARDAAEQQALENIRQTGQNLREQVRDERALVPAFEEGGTEPIWRQKSKADGLRAASAPRANERYVVSPNAAGGFEYQPAKPGLAAPTPAGERAKTPSPSQEARNGDIHAARRSLEGLTREQIVSSMQQMTPTGRPNPDFNPFVARAARLASRRLTGEEDLDHEQLWGKMFPEADMGLQPAGKAGSVPVTPGAAKPPATPAALPFANGKIDHTKLSPNSIYQHPKLGPLRWNGKSFDQVR